MSKQKSSARFRFTGAVLLLGILIFLVPALQSGSSTLWLLCALIPCAILISGTLIARMFSLDRMILTVSLWLCATGIAALAVSDPDAAMAQSLCCGAGLAALLAGGVLIRSLTSSMLTSVCTAFLGLLLLAGKLFAPSFSLPMTEVALTLLLISFAALFTRQGPVSAVVCASAALALLLFRGDTADALFWGLTVLLLLFAVDGRLVILLPSLAAMAVLFFVAFTLFPASAVPQENMLSALVSSGAIGSDVLPEAIASIETVSLFPRLAGHYGLIFSGLTVFLFLPLILRGATVAACARTRLHGMLAMGISLLLSLRTLAALLSLFGLLPFTDVAVPFLTRSLPDLCAELFLTGLLCGISGRNDADLAEDAHLAMLAQ